KSSYLQIMKKIIQLIGCMGLFLQFAMAQQQTITGYIKGADNTPIANASIYLVTDPNRSFIKSAVTDAEGKYILHGFPQGSFRIEATAVGYAKGESNEFTTDEKSIEVRDINLQVLSKEIEAVSVQAQLPQIQ